MFVELFEVGTFGFERGIFSGINVVMSTISQTLDIYLNIYKACGRSFIDILFELLKLYDLTIAIVLSNCRTTVILSY